MLPESRLRRRRGPWFDIDEPTSAPVASVRPVLPEPRAITTPTYAEPIPTRAPVAPAPILPATPPPLTTTDRRNRPRLIGGLSTQEQLPAEQELFTRLQSYTPQKRSIMRQIGLGALRGFLAGGPGGAMGGAIFGAGTALLDPTAEDRAWQEKQMAQSMGRQQIYRGQQREGLEDDLLRARVEETQAQAEQRRNPRPKLVETVLPDGTTVLAPEQEGIVTGRPKPEGPTYAIDVPGGARIEGLKPGEAAGYYGQIGRQRTEAEIRGEERLSQAERARISLSEAESAEKENLIQRKAESERLGQLRAQRTKLKPDPSLVTNGQINDPNYWAQADSLDAQIKDAETEVARRQRLADEAGTTARQLRGEVGRYGTRPATSTTPPPPAGVSEASIRAEARRRNSGKSEAEILAAENEALRKAREFKWIP